MRRHAALEAPDARREILLTLAELQAARLGDGDGARATLAGALELGLDERVLRAAARLADDGTAMMLWALLAKAAPDDAEALTELAALYERHERFGELAAILERQVAAASTEAAPALVEQLALVHLRTGKRAAAEAAWRRLAALTPDAPAPWQALARMYTTAESWTELAAVLERLVALAATPAETIATATQLARVEADRLERPERAIAAWQRVLAAGGPSDDALAALATLFARSGRADERRRVVEERAELAARAGGATAIAAFAEAADVAAGEGDGAAAARWYERVLALDPRHAVAQSYLEASYREHRDWPALVSLLGARAAQLPPAERGELLTQVAAIEEHELGDAAAAFRTLLDAFEGDGRWATYGDDLEAPRARPRRLAALGRGDAASRRRRAGRAPGAVSRARQRARSRGADRPRRSRPTARCSRSIPTSCRCSSASSGIYRVGRPVGAARGAGAPRRAHDRQRRAAAPLPGSRRRGGAPRALGARRRRAPALGGARAASRGRGQQLYRAGVIYRDHLAAFDEALDCFEAAADSYSADG